MGASVIKALVNSKCSEQLTDLIAERLLDFANLPFKRKKTFNQLHKMKMLYPQD